MIFFSIIGICILFVPSLQHQTPIQNMTVTHVWKNLPYGFECPEDYQYAIESGSYVEKGFKRPYDADIVVLRNRKVHIYMSTPRVVPGIPYTLVEVSNKKTELGPLLLPFPNYKAHSERDTPSCDRIISVFRIFVDACKRLWAIDTGRNFFASPTQVCPPKILVYDLETKQLLLKYEIPKGQYLPEQTVYNGIIVDIYDPPPHGQCQFGKAYLTDARGHSLLVFDLYRRESWVIFNDLFKPNPAYLNSTIAGETFTFPDGLYTSTPDRSKYHQQKLPQILTLSFGDFSKIQYRRNRLTLHSYAAVDEIAADLSKVNDQRLWENNPSGNQHFFKVIGRRKTQCPTQAMDLRSENIYFSQLQPLSILSWNPDKSYDPYNFKRVVENSEILQFVAGLKVRLNSIKKEIVLALSNRLQRLNTGTISLNEENYRLMVCQTSTLQSGIGECGGL